MRAASNFIALILSRLIRQMLAFFLELNSKELYQSSEKEKESCCLVFPSSTKREMRHFRNRKLKQRRRRWQRKRLLKSEFALLQALSRLFHLIYLVKCWQMF